MSNRELFSFMTTRTYELQERILTLPVSQEVEISHLEPDPSLHAKARGDIRVMACMDHQKVAGKHSHVYWKKFSAEPECDTANDGKPCILLESGSTGCIMRIPSLHAIIKRRKTEANAVVGQSSFVNLA